MNAPKVMGVDINLGGRDFLVPPLSMNQLQRFLPKLKTLDPKNMDDTTIEIMVEVTHAALSRNYPDMKVEELKDLIDMGNLKDLFEAVTGTSGLRRVSAGESKALAQSNLTSISSTPASAPTQDGLGTT